MVAAPHTQQPGGSSAAARERTARGHESSTLAERFIEAFRLPYALGCLVVGLLLFGLFDTWLYMYAATSDPWEALNATLRPQNVLVDLLVAYAFYVPRYMRTKLSEAGVSLSTLLPGGEESYRRIFARVSAVKPQLVAWVLFLAGLLLAVNVSAILGAGPSTIVFGGGPSSVLEFVAGVYDIISLGVVTLGLSSVVWTYWTISRGIHRFGGEPLSLRPYYEDSFLGLKPVGSLALALASAYFGFLALFALVLAASPSSPSAGDLIGVGGFLAGLILLGLALFFLPLRRLHRQMIQRKHFEGGRLQERLAPVFHEHAQDSAPKDIGHLFRLDMMDRKVSSMALWPFDIRILGRLSVIALSVTAILISRIVALALKI